MSLAVIYDRLDRLMGLASPLSSTSVDLPLVMQNPLSLIQDSPEWEHGADLPRPRRFLTPAERRRRAQERKQRKASKRRNR